VADQDGIRSHAERWLSRECDLDFSKTKTVRVASQKIGKDLWHQVYQVTFTKTSGETLEAIVVHDASTEECSMTGVEVFVVSKHLNQEGK